MNTVTTSTVTKGHRMIDRADTEAALARVAFAAFLYHPTKHLDEPGWTVDEDIDWALVPLRDLDAAARAVWRERIREVITNPSADRRAFIADLTALAGSGGGDPTPRG
jgi:hypothetical protein